MAGHTEQAEALPYEYRPGGHASWPDPPGQAKPAAQTAQAVCPGAEEYVAASQAGQAVPPQASEKCPALQAVQLSLPGAVQVPALHTNSGNEPGHICDEDNAAAGSTWASRKRL